MADTGAQSQPPATSAALCPSQLTSNSLTSGHLPHPPVHTEHEVDCVQRQGMTTIMLAIREECEVLVALDLDRRDNEEWTALMFSVDKGVGEMQILLPVTLASATQELL